MLAALACAPMLYACDGLIYDDEGDCTVNYRVKFRYDYNMKFADAFAREVNTVTLYLLDAEGRVVWQRTEQGEALSADGYAMTGNEAFVAEDLDRLFHGWLPEQTFGETEGTYTYTVPLVKNTNNVRVVLQHLSGEAMDKDRFVFTITDTNGSMDWDNSLRPDEPVTFYAWHTDAGEAGLASLPDGNAHGPNAVFSAAIAELTVPRLVKEQDPRLTVTDREKERTVFSIPLIDYALLVKGFYNRNMDDQEYLDRQDVYDMVFFLDEGDRWLDTYIYINSWKVVLQNSDL